MSLAKNKGRGDFLLGIFFHKGGGRGSRGSSEEPIVLETL